MAWRSALCAALATALTDLDTRIVLALGVEILTLGAKMVFLVIILGRLLEVLETGRRGEDATEGEVFYDVEEEDSEQNKEKPSASQKITRTIARICICSISKSCGKRERGEYATPRGRSNKARKKAKRSGDPKAALGCKRKYGTDFEAVKRRRRNSGGSIW
ncbi:hypothetical protein BSKO_14020 [Bryopsis sp. KO-2023]|nr:hypothetical protein BSKO_14020 [Bryopsis sp. KO-2023]